MSLLTLTYDRMMRTRLGLLAAVLGLGLLAPVPHAAAAGDLVEVLPGPQAYFSPNGDGRRDTLPVRFRLGDRAQVVVLVRELGLGPDDPRGIVDRIRLGTRGPGVHTWRWDGRGVASGSYHLVLRARTEAGRTDRDVKYAAIDRGEALREVRIRITRATLYPQTPGKVDAIHVHSTKEGNTTEISIADASGDVVFVDDFRQWWSWDGAQLPPGEYDATFMVHDHYGNRREIDRELRISPEHLVQQVWSTTAAAADLERFRVSSDACLPTPSARFDDGLTLTRGPDCYAALFVPRIPLPVDVDPDVTWRLGITGGPTVPGEDDTAEVVIAGPTDNLDVRTGTGDTATTTPWGGPHPYEWDREAEPTGWVRVVDAGASYDVATVTLEVRYWTVGPELGRRS